MFKGIITALVTPLKDGKIDEITLGDLVTLQVEQGVDGVVPCGSTGESLLLTSDEQKRVIEIVVEAANKRIFVLAGTSGVTVDQTVAYSTQAQKAGADGALIITPWYVKPSQESLVHYFGEVHDRTRLPIVLYNNPGRCGVGLDVETIVTLSTKERIVGIKDSSPDLTRVVDLRGRVSPDFKLLSGEDATTGAYMAMGGDGWISVISNIAPRECGDLLKAWETADLQTFAKLRDRLNGLIHALSCAPNPQPIKYATSLLKPMSLESRLPYVPLEASKCEGIRKAMVEAGLIQDSKVTQLRPR